MHLSTTNTIKRTVYQIGLTALRDQEVHKFLGHTFHGALGNALKKECCVNVQDTRLNMCDNCTCLFGEWFEANTNEIPASELIKYKPISPHVIQCDFTPGTGTNRIFPGEPLNWELFILGQNSNDSDLVLRVIHSMFTAIGPLQTPWRVDGIKTQQDELSYTLHLNDITEFVDVTVRFETPFQVSNKDRAQINTNQGTIEIPFPLLFKYILKRLHTIQLFFGAHAEEDTSKQKALLRLSDQADIQICDLVEIEAWPRQLRGYPVYGYIGTCVYKQVDKRLLNLLNMATKTHIGGWASFGLGRFTYFVL